MAQPASDANETELEKTIFLQLLDLENQRAELPSNEPARSELESTYDVIEDVINATLQSIRDGRVAKVIEGAGRNADSIRMDDIAQAELDAQEERGRLLGISKLSIGQPDSPSSAGSGSSNPLSATNPEGSDLESPISTTADPGSISPSSSQANTDKTVPPLLRLPTGSDTVECIVCKDPTAEAFKAPCGCFYDQKCITKLFDKATTDESLFPPKCCNEPIPLEKIRTLLPPESIQNFEKKTEEFNTPNKLYCTNETCSKFLGSASTTERDKSNIICRNCSTSTCSFCKNESHAAHIPCKTDVAAQQVLTLGSQNGWMACPSCHHLVEKDGGCNDMVCRCGYEFCYGCGVKWGECRHG
ncbi:unnamed protein product [Rhizoctonia solani]|uniref:RBR-type E3 ubiquitin transferase n=1 Tax=Rhizoctonia solani TaxID=456999 RepID=A0A8H3E485_9AGAM|nr:unnamed protein product [Rhizoctonia solani]